MMKKVKIIIAPNSYKSSIDSFRICQIIEEEFKELISSEYIIESLPIGDGGDGTAYIIARNLGAIKKYYKTVDPLGRSQSAPMYLSNHTAIIEMADIVGLRKLDSIDYNPHKASSEGLGKMITKLHLEGINKLILCIGGSATIDMGLGALKGMGAIFYDEYGDEIYDIVSSRLIDIKRIDTSHLSHYKNLKIDILCDVENSLLGDNGAIRVYGPQKGIQEHELNLFESQHKYMCKFLENLTNKTLKSIKYGGAAGGLPIGMSAFFNVNLYRGSDYLLDMLEFDDKLVDCKLLISGEGCMDEQSSFGKAPCVIADRARLQSINCIALNGQTKSLPSSYKDSFSLVDYSNDFNEAINNPEPYIRKAARDIANLINDSNILS